MTVLDDLPFPAFGPPEDLLLAVFRPLELAIPNLKVRSFIEDDLFSCPYLMVRAGKGSWNSDSFGSNDTRFTRRTIVDVQSWTEDPDGDEKGAALQELARLTLFAAWRKQVVYPGLGSIGFARVSSPARRASDWATSTGSNQYANLPRGTARFQALYGVTMRPPRDVTSSAVTGELVALLNS